MKFRFTLEKLLEHKRTLERQAQKAWAEAQANVDRATKELNALYAAVDEARHEVPRMEREGRSAASVAQVDEFINGQKIRIERKRGEIRELLAIAEARQVELVEAAKERKTLEKVREKRLDDFKLRRKKHELKENDELVVTRFKRADDF
jgi:flagellar FliJ protein